MKEPSRNFVTSEMRAELQAVGLAICMAVVKCIGHALPCWRMDPHLQGRSPVTDSRSHTRNGIDLLSFAVRALGSHK